MQRTRALVCFIVVALVLGSAGCTGSGGSTSGGRALDTSKAVELAIGEDGGGQGLSTGDAYAAVYVPPGAAKSGATWTITPLAEAPKGVPTALCPGISVDTAGAEPTDWCTIGFSLPTTASPDATIVKLADDGTVAEVVATSRMDYGGRTFLTADVQGFSKYTTAEEDQEARDQAWVDQAKKKGQQPDWTIKVIGDETQENQGWTFNFSLDFFASGGGVATGGTYKGHAMLDMEGTYDDAGATAPFFTTMGTVNAIGRDQNLTFQMIDSNLANLLTGADADMPCAQGVMNLEGMGDLNIQAFGIQGEHGEVDTQDQQTKSPVAFTLKVTTFEDVQVEIENVGIFPGKILRTAQ
jgi:hypothetical protein